MSFSVWSQARVTKNNLTTTGIWWALTEYFHTRIWAWILWSRVVRVDDLHGQICIESTRSTFCCLTWAMDFASIFSKEPSRMFWWSGYAWKIGSWSSLHRSFSKVSVSKRFFDPLHSVSEKLLERQSENRSSSCFLYSLQNASVSLLRNLKAGECDVMPYPNPADLKRLDLIKHQLNEQEGLERRLFRRLTLRKNFYWYSCSQALKLCNKIKNADLLIAVFQGAGKRLKNQFPANPCAVCITRKLWITPYGSVKAKKLLAEAGYPVVSQPIFLAMASYNVHIKPKCPVVCWNHARRLV